jgi:hypothetical protein
VRWVSLGLGGAGLAAWLYGYVYIQGLACAFGSVSGNCALRMPWQLGREDFLLLVALPMAVLLPVFGLALWSWRR